VGAREDDTELDGLAAHARAHPALPAGTVDRLIRAAAAGDDGAQDTLVEQALGVVLDAAMARRDRGLELTDLFQEGSVAAIVAVGEYVSRGGSGAQLNAYVRRVVDAHLERVVEREHEELTDTAAMLRDVRLLEGARVQLRRRSRREPTSTEVGAALGWPPAKVALVAGLLVAAQDLFDTEIVQFLDDAGDEDP
jgi:DNA-directed RNA polymerase sigma subunit (sigma70/sigma32)